MAINMSNQTRVPMLKPCPCCGGTADYFEGKTPVEVVARCTACGLETASRQWASGAGRQWNARITAGARIVTLAELRELEFGQGDANGAAAVWIEDRRDGALRAAVLAFDIDLGEPTVHEYGMGYESEWSPEDVAAEGKNWRLWDRKPTIEDSQGAQWDGLAWEEARMKRARERTDALLEAMHGEAARG